MARRYRKNEQGLFDLMAEVLDMLFAHIPTGWSLPMAAGWLCLGGGIGGRIAFPLVTLLIFVLLGLVPALITLLAAWKASRKKRLPFLTFGFGVDRAYESHLDAVFAPKPRVDATAAPRSPLRQTSEEDAIYREVYRSPDQVGHTWTLELLRELEWRRFELLVEGLFRHQKDWHADGGTAGADGGIDLLLYAPGDSQPTAAVQCKAYRTQQVGVGVVRELYGVMAAEKIPHGLVFTCGEFSADAVKFAENKSVDLVSGRHLLTLIRELSPEANAKLLREITAGDYRTPTCPTCRVKMVVRKGARGPFWGCARYPACRQTMHGAA